MVHSTPSPRLSMLCTAPGQDVILEIIKLRLLGMADDVVHLVNQEVPMLDSNVGSM